MEAHRVLQLSELSQHEMLHEIIKFENVVHAAQGVTKRDIKTLCSCKLKRPV